MTLTTIRSFNYVRNSFRFRMVVRQWPLPRVSRASRRGRWRKHDDDFYICRQGAAE